MAAAIRLDPAVSRTAPLALVAVGDFGRRVARLLIECFHGGRHIAASDLAGAFTADAAAVVVAVPSPAWALCERADELAYEHGKPWLAVVMEHPVLRVGPLVSPPSGPCFACYRARRFQHDTAPAASAALEAAYDADPSLIPAGYLPQHARLAAGLAARFLASGETGQVFAFDVLSSRGSVHRVISCHDCDREAPAGS